MSQAMDFIEPVVDFVASLSVLESVLLVIGAILLCQGGVRVWRLVHGSPGPVRIEEFVDGAKDTSVKQLTELVRERLAETGLFSPNNPVGSPGDAVTAAVKAVPIPQTKWLADFITHIPGLIRPRYGHQVKGTAWKGQGEEITLVIEIGDIPSGRAERTIVIDGEVENVAQRAAADIYAEVVSHPRVWRTLKPWERWPSSGGEGLAALYTGRAAEDRGELAAALEDYRRAVGLEPTNAVARLQLANTLEIAAESGSTPKAKLNALLEATELYQTTGAVWPKLWEARYRLAAVLSFLPLWRKAWETPPTVNQKRRFKDLLGLEALPGNQVPEETLLTVSAAVWDTVGDVPKAMEKAVSLAKACTLAQQAIREADAPRLKTLVARAAERAWPAHWARRYNALCLRSFGTAPTLDPAARRTNGIAAIRDLDVLAQEVRDFRVEMAKVDPDLEHLRNWLKDIPAAPPDPGLPRSLPLWKGVFAS